ncbi:MAG: DUF6575 domain-containing protein [bacterium]
MNTIALETEFGPLALVELYFYYDGPRLFSAVSGSGQLFLVLWDGQVTPGTDDWLVARQSRARLESIRAGQVDLHDAFQQAEDGLVYRIQASAAGPVPLRVIATRHLDESELPMPGRVLAESGDLDAAIQAAYAAPLWKVQEEAAE